MFDSQWALGSEQATDAFSIRKAVFVEELQQPETAVFDENDALCAHLLVRVDGKPAAAGRMRPYQSGVIMEYICVLKEYRKQGFGDLCARIMLDKARRMGTARIYVCAPEKYRSYYAAFGFMGDGAELSVSPEEIIWHNPCQEN